MSLETNSKRGQGRLVPLTPTTKDEVQHPDDFPCYVSPSITESGREYSASGHIVAAVEGYIYIEVDKTVHESERCYISPTVSYSIRA